MELINIIDLNYLLDEKIIKNLEDIYKKFKHSPIVEASLKAQKEKDEKEMKEEMNTPDYMTFFIKDLIEKISFLLENKFINIDNINIQIVVCYLFKIIISNFKFFPSHKLVLIIYRYFVKSIIIIDDELIEENISSINNDLIDCFVFLKEEFNKDGIDFNYNEFKLDRNQSFPSNVRNIMKILYKLNINKPYLEFFVKFRKELNDKEKLYYSMIINYLKNVNKDQSINQKINLYTLMSILLNNNKEINKCININEEDVNKMMNIINESPVNNDIKNIFSYSLKLLTAKNIDDIDRLRDSIKDIDCQIPSISKEFDNNQKYYKSLLDELFYKIKNMKDLPNIYYYPKAKKNWCLIIEFLDILLNDKDMGNAQLKFLF